MTEHVKAAEGQAEGPPSPFLPDSNVQWCWDSTSLGWFKTCPRLYQYQMIEGWRPRAISFHLEFGLIYHAALERYDYARAKGMDHEVGMIDAVRYAMTASWDSETGAPKDWQDNAKTRENLVRTIVWYLEQFKDDGLETVILANGKPAVELSFKLPLGSLWLSGHIDRLVRFQGQVYVSDRKTTKSTPGQYYFQQYEPHNQMSLYSLAASMMYDQPVAGVIIDAAQIAVGFSRFERGMTYRSKAQLDEWHADLFEWTNLAEGMARRGHWPMNDTSCTKYGACPFQKVCSKSPVVRHSFLETDFIRQPWNPLDNRGEK